MTSKTETRNDKLQAVHDKLQQAVANIVSGEDWQRMLKVASKFHKYSFNNQLLIFLQRPDASHVAGFNRWKSLGRTVRKGEKGIQIFAPCRYKVELDPAVEVAVPDGDRPKPKMLRGFRVVHVFDISQTDGDPIEGLDGVRPVLLDGEAPEGLWDALVSQATNAGFEVVHNERGSANGYCDFVGKGDRCRPRPVRSTGGQNSRARAGPRAPPLGGSPEPRDRRSRSGVRCVRSVGCTGPGERRLLLSVRRPLGWRRPRQNPRKR